MLRICLFRRTICIVLNNSIEFIPQGFDDLGVLQIAIVSFTREVADDIVINDIS